MEPITLKFYRAEYRPHRSYSPWFKTEEEAGNYLREDSHMPIPWTIGTLTLQADADTNIDTLLSIINSIEYH